MYKTTALTGLRRSEIASLTVGDVTRDGAPSLRILPKHEKARRGALVPLRADLARELCDWLDGRLAREQAEARAADKPIPARVSPADRLFVVPTLKTFDRDLDAAEIAKRDESGRTVDFHSLRSTFATLLSKGGVAPRIAQSAMRHSSIDLTMNVYTDPVHLDVRAALDALPEIPLVEVATETAVAVGAESVDASGARKGALAPVPTGPSESISDHLTANANETPPPPATPQNCTNTQEKTLVPGDSGRGQHGGPEGIRTPDLCIANAALSHLSYRPLGPAGAELRVRPDRGEARIIQIAFLGRNALESL